MNFPKLGWKLDGEKFLSLETNDLPFITLTINLSLCSCTVRLLQPVIQPDLTKRGHGAKKERGPLFSISSHFSVCQNKVISKKRFIFSGQPL